MRSKNSIWYGFLFVLLWASATYFLFLYRPMGGKAETETDRKVNRLEQDLTEQLVLSGGLKSQLQEIIGKHKLLSTNDGKPKEEDKEHEEQRQQQESDDEAVRMRALSGARLPDGGPVLAVLMLACNRVTVSRSLEQLLRLRPSAAQFPVIVSQDCRHRPTAQAIAEFGDQLTAMQQPDQSEIAVPPREKKFKGYFKIARHYGWALNRTFFDFGFDSVIIVEDDLDISVDFFEYFLATHSLLRRDRSLWCVSAWNDNGKPPLVDETAHAVLHRTDFFPGLGWMLTKDAWRELAPKWPPSYWDDWMRQPEQRQGRACIRPELSRTRTFGKVGVSNGFFFEKHLKYIKLNDKFVPFTTMNLTHLTKDVYDGALDAAVNAAPVVTYAQLRAGDVPDAPALRIIYHTKETFKKTAKMLGLMEEFRSGVPRTGYRGVVSFMHQGRRVYLAPNANWRGYDPAWS